jgi:hemoglobin-like flavoprotein
MAQSDVDASYARCVTNPKFLDRFYEIFVRSHPDIGPMFKDTDFAKQKMALRSGLSLLLMLEAGKPFAVETLSKIGATHGAKGKWNVPHKLYPYWIDSLMAAIKECDPEFKPELETPWKNALQKGVNYIISHG